jgi:hypothetical protein
LKQLKYHPPCFNKKCKKSILKDSLSTILSNDEKTIYNFLSTKRYMMFHRNQEFTWCNSCNKIDLTDRVSEKRHKNLQTCHNKSEAKNFQSCNGPLKSTGDIFDPLNLQNHKFQVNVLAYIKTEFKVCNN